MIAVIVEEHHEAFFVWNYAKIMQCIADVPHTLLHVDDHADMSLPRLRTSLKQLDSNLPALFAFTRKELGIGDFIYPAIYQGLFKEIYWLKQGRKYVEAEQYLNIVSQQGEGRVLIATDNFLQAGIFNPDRKSAVFRQIDDQQTISPAAPVILDIDLDYFACDSIAGERWEMQVTLAEYERFCREPYHRLHLKFGGKLQAEQRDSQYYFVYHPLEEQTQQEINLEQVAVRIDRFIAWLQNNQICPVLIDVCRSRFSGYTPETHWQWIETQLLNRLSAIFPIEMTYLDRLLANE